MIKNRNETSAAMDKALKNLEQAKARYAVSYTHLTLPTIA